MEWLRRQNSAKTKNERREGGSSKKTLICTVVRGCTVVLGEGHCADGAWVGQSVYGTKHSAKSYSELKTAMANEFNSHDRHFSMLVGW